MDSFRAYAKINLHLEVLNRRNDGYHNIFSIMASVGLHDLLKLEKLDITGGSGTASAVSIVNRGGDNASVLDDIPVEDNIITRAVLAYFNKAGVSGDVVFALTKNIPSGAGMAGGSTDAAAAIMLLNNSLNRFSTEELLDMAAPIGADVPFCLRGGFALCRGIGDVVTPLPGGLPYQVVIVNRGIHVNTGEAYRALNRDGDETKWAVPTSGFEDAINDALSRGTLDGVVGLLRNDFEEPVFAVHPQLRELKEYFYHNGALFSAMTGSGSSIIALYDNEDRADKVFRDLSCQGSGQVVKTAFLNNTIQCMQ
jgi:4-diphosphocytidyl-2-C-methyl-D-erythritol kinase